MALDPKDGGMTSRKLLLTIGVMLMIIGCWLLTAKWTGLVPTFDTVVGGLLAASGLFMTGNVASKWVIAKANSGTSFQGEMKGKGPNKPEQKADGEKEQGT